MSLGWQVFIVCVHDVFCVMHLSLALRLLLVTLMDDLDCNFICKLKHRGDTDEVMLRLASCWGHDVEKWWNNAETNQERKQYCSSYKIRATASPRFCSRFKVNQKLTWGRKSLTCMNRRVWVVFGVSGQTVLLKVKGQYYYFAHFVCKKRLQIKLNPSSRAGYAACLDSLPLKMCLGVILLGYSLIGIFKSQKCFSFLLGVVSPWIKTNSTNYWQQRRGF